MTEFLLVWGGIGVIASIIGGACRGYLPLEIFTLNLILGPIGLLLTVFISCKGAVIWRKRE